MSGADCSLVQYLSYCMMCEVPSVSKIFFVIISAFSYVLEDLIYSRPMDQEAQISDMLEYNCYMGEYCYESKTV